MNEVVLAAATQATESSGGTVTVTEVTVEAPTTTTEPVVVNDTPTVEPDNVVQTFNFTLITVQLGGQNVALALSSAVTDVAALGVGTTVVGTQITGNANAAQIFSVAQINAALGITLSSAQVDLLVAAVEGVLGNAAVVTNDNGSIRVSPSS